jgi:hypothetical protein
MKQPPLISSIPVSFKRARLFCRWDPSPIFIFSTGGTRSLRLVPSALARERRCPVRIFFSGRPFFKVRGEGRLRGLACALPGRAAPVFAVVSHVVSSQRRCCDLAQLLADGNLAESTVFSYIFGEC